MQTNGVNFHKFSGVWCVIDPSSGIDGDGPLVIFELLTGWKYIEEVSIDLRKYFNLFTG